MIAIQAVSYHHFGLRVALSQFFPLYAGYLTIGERGFDPLNIHRRDPGGAPSHQTHQPGILVAVVNWIMLLCFQRTAVFQRLRLRAGIGCAIQGMDLIARHLFTVGGLKFIQCLG